MSDPHAIEGLEPLDERQMEERGLDFDAYWKKREQDMRDQKAFWRRWSERWDVNTDWPFRR